MKTRSLEELKDLLSGQKFADWWREYGSARQELEAGRERLDALLALENTHAFRAELLHKKGVEALDTESRGEDLAARLRSEASELDNRSFETVASFEQKRVKVSILWSKVGAHELRIEEIKECVDARDAGLPTSEECAPLLSVTTNFEGIKGELGRLSAEYGQEERKKQQLWDEVEAAWDGAFERLLRAAEAETRSRKLRAESEAMFSDAEQNRRLGLGVGTKVEEWRHRIGHLEKWLDELRTLARARFECVAGRDFLYWPESGTGHSVLCVALTTEARTYGIEIEPLRLYRTDREQGAHRLAPAGDGAVVAGTVTPVRLESARA